MASIKTWYQPQCSAIERSYLCLTFTDLIRPELTFSNNAESLRDLSGIDFHDWSRVTVYAFLSCLKSLLVDCHLLSMNTAANDRVQ